MPCALLPVLHVNASLHRPTRAHEQRGEHVGSTTFLRPVPPKKHNKMSIQDPPPLDSCNCRTHSCTMHGCVMRQDKKQANTLAAVLRSRVLERVQLHFGKSPMPAAGVRARLAFGSSPSSSLTTPPLRRRRLPSSAPFISPPSAGRKSSDSGGICILFSSLEFVRFSKHRSESTHWKVCAQ
jgi:hypothetical protein